MLLGHVHMISRGHSDSIGYGIQWRALLQAGAGRLARVQSMCELNSIMHPVPNGAQQLCISLLLCTGCRTVRTHCAPLILHLAPGAP